MAKIRYKFDWRVLTLVFGAFAFILFALNIGVPNYPQALEGNLIIGGFLLFLLINFTIGTFGLLDKQTGVLSRTDYLFRTKKMRVRDIKNIYYRSTWIIGGFARSLYIAGDDERVIEFPNVGWYEPVLAKMVRDLRQINPSIHLDEHAEALLRKYAKS